MQSYNSVALAPYLTSPLKPFLGKRKHVIHRVNTLQPNGSNHFSYLSLSFLLVWAFLFILYCRNENSTTKNNLPLLSSKMVYFAVCAINGRFDVESANVQRIRHSVLCLHSTVLYEFHQFWADNKALFLKKSFQM